MGQGSAWERWGAPPARTVSGAPTSAPTAAVPPSKGVAGCRWPRGASRCLRPHAATPPTACAARVGLLGQYRCSLPEPLCRGASLQWIDVVDACDAVAIVRLCLACGAPCPHHPDGNVRDDVAMDPGM